MRSNWPGSLHEAIGRQQDWDLKDAAMLLIGGITPQMSNWRQATGNRDGQQANQTTFKSDVGAGSPEESMCMEYALWG